MQNVHLNSRHEACAKQLEASRHYRVLRALPDPYCNMPGNGAPPDGKCLAICDVESSGLDPDQDHLIELAIMLVFVDELGEVIGHLRPHAWLEDPGIEIDPRISLLTGLSSEDLTGQKINDPMAAGLLDRADLIVAHNAAFDARWIERRYPQSRGRPWACSFAEIDWLRLGWEGRSQQHLLNQHGWFSNCHRASDDVWSLYWLLQQRQRAPGDDKSRTHLERLLEASGTSSIMIRAEGAPFGRKDALKAREFRWNARERVWQKEIRQHEVEAERRWFWHNGLPAFTTRDVTARERHR